MAIAHVKLGPMPGAHQTKSVEFAISERPAIMRAQILNGVHGSIDGNDYHKAIVDFKGLWYVRLEFRKFANVMKIERIDDRFFRDVVDVFDAWMRRTVSTRLPRAGSIVLCS